MWYILSLTVSRNPIFTSLMFFPLVFKISQMQFSRFEIWIYLFCRHLWFIKWFSWSDLINNSSSSNDIQNQNGNDGPLHSDGMSSILSSSISWSIWALLMLWIISDGMSAFYPTLTGILSCPAKYPPNGQSWLFQCFECLNTFW